MTDAVTGLPIAGATVQVTDSSNVVHTVTTDVTGHYGITNLPTGPATLTASQTGYASATSHPTINLGPNTQDEALTANTLAGVVTNTISGLPIVGATVVVVDSASVTNTLTTDAAGHYAVTNIAAGAATVTASKSGYTTATATPTIVAGVNAQDLGLTANTLTGVVTDAITGLPIAGATVQLTDSSNVVHTVSTDVTGHYGITNVPAGPATLTASRTGYASATSNPAIVPGPNTQDEALTANTLTGVVTDAITGLSIAGATVQVTDSSNVVHTVTTDAGGHYGVTNLPAGPATLTASQTGYASATSHPSIVPGPNTQDEALTANTLAGMVTDAFTSAPIAGATVVVVDSANVTHTATTDAAGHYAVTNIAVGIAAVTASKPGYTTASTSPIIVTGANTQNLSLTANTLAGVVTDAITGLPIAGATVQVTDSSNVVHTVSTDATGHYGIAALPTGPATLTASKTGYTTATASPTIVAGPNTQNVSLTANTLTGQVTDSGDAPADHRRNRAGGG